MITAELGEIVRVAGSEFERIHGNNKYRSLDGRIIVKGSGLSWPRRPTSTFIAKIDGVVIPGPRRWKLFRTPEAAMRAAVKEIEP